MLELKHVLVDIDCSDFQYFDEILSDLKLSPADIEIPTPAFFRRDNLKQLKEREKVLDALDAARIDPREREPEKEPLPMSVEEAVRIVQMHERARQGRLRAKFMQVCLLAVHVQLIALAAFNAEVQSGFAGRHTRLPDTLRAFCHRCHTTQFSFPRPLRYRIFALARSGNAANVKIRARRLKRSTQ